VGLQLSEIQFSECMRERELDDQIKLDYVIRHS